MKEVIPQSIINIQKQSYYKLKRKKQTISYKVIL